MTEERLIRLAGFVRKFHRALFSCVKVLIHLTAVLVLLSLIFTTLSAVTASLLNKAAIAGLIYVCGLSMGTALGELLFLGDCPLTLLEFCLRGLGGEKFSYSRFYTMTELAEREMAPRDIYRRLLWRSSVYTLIVGVAMIAAAILVTLSYAKAEGF